MYDEIDLQIVNLLQIDSRIPWAAAGQILGVSASSLARRWARLSAEGLAWITTYPNPVTRGVTGFIDVHCADGRVNEIATELCLDPRVLSLDQCAGGRDLLLTVIVPSQVDLTTLVLDTIGRLPGVTRTTCSVVTEVHSEGSAWRVDALDPAQRHAAAAQVTPPRAGAATGRVDGRLLTALARDGRAGVASLARELGRPTSSVHRELSLLRSQGSVVSRCDVAPELSGWFIEWSWLANVPIGQKQAVADTLRSRPEVRMCMSLAGAANLVFTVRAHQLAELRRFERMLATAHPWLAPLETMVHLRPRKRMGWLLTPEGTTTGQLIVPDFEGCPSPERGSEGCPSPERGFEGCPSPERGSAECPSPEGQPAYGSAGSAEAELAEAGLREADSGAG